jgi:tetratricopeptide (TPR) repeat protein
MEHEHLDDAVLERLLAVDRNDDQNRELFHLLAVCPSCREAGGWLLDLHRKGELPARFGPVDAALARSRAEAPGLWDELSPLDSEEWLVRVHADRRFVSWGLCELLIRDSREVAPEDFTGAAVLADLAVHVADLMSDGEPFEESWIYQLRALAWGSLGNARRVGGRLPEAEHCFEMSDTWWDAGTRDAGDVLGYEPILLNLKASLRIPQRRFAEAFTLLDRVADLYLHGQPEYRDPHLAGRALVQKAHAQIEMGETETAIEILKKANGWIDPQRDPRLHLCLRHDLVYCLDMAGHYLEADASLPELRALAETHGSRFDRIRLDWVEGRVAAGLGDTPRARRLLSDVRQAFLSEANAYDAALATLDLVVPCLQEGNTAEVRTLAEEMVAVFRHQEVAREALAAWLLFHQAAVREAVTVELTREVAASLHQARSGGA